MGGRGSSSSKGSAARNSKSSAARAEKLADPSEYGRIWEKGNYKRLYMNKERLQEAVGLKIDRYKSGNSASASLNGETISNSRGGRILYSISNSYIDMKTGKAHSTGDETELVEEAMNKLKKKIKLN